MPPHLSGASPTLFYVGNALFQNVMETGKKMFEERKNIQPSYLKTSTETVQNNFIVNGEVAGYNELHQVAFAQTLDERMVLDAVENDYEKLNRRDNNGNTPLMWAASVGNEQLVELLIDQGASVNLQNFVGETALYIAAARGFEKICALLIENGSNTRFSTLEGSSPLHIAAASGHVSIVYLLATRGAYLNSTDEEGDTPLHYAVREGQKQVVDVLARLGADFHMKNDDDESPLDLAIDIGENSYVDNFNRSGKQTQMMETSVSENHPLFFGEENESSVRRETGFISGDLAAKSARNISIF
jgi:ankyrin repeat protein